MAPEQHHCGNLAGSKPRSQWVTPGSAAALGRSHCRTMEGDEADAERAEAKARMAARKEEIKRKKAAAAAAAADAPAPAPPPSDTPPAAAAAADGHAEQLLQAQQAQQTA
eukprot:COSAG04_NODE_18562_length_438_cov_1.058997_1_plen_109_part_10